MNIHIVKNKYLNAMLVLMLFSAAVHMVILVFFALASRDLYVLNYFNILDVDLLYPAIFNTAAGNIFAGIFMIGLYLAILKLNEHGK